jgi:predicted amino acid racemase
VYPQLTVAIDRIAGITRSIARTLSGYGIQLVGVTKAIDGEPAVAEELLQAGCTGLADSRLPAIARLAAQGLGPVTLIRSPQPDEIATAARLIDRAIMCDPGAAQALGAARARAGAGSPGAARARAAATPRPIDLLVGVDLGDRREGVLPQQARQTAQRLAGLPGIALAGVAVNFACLSGLLPSVPLIRQAEDILLSIAPLCHAEPVLSLGGTCCLKFAGRYEPRVRTEIRSGVGVLMGWDLCAGAPLPGIDRVEPVLAAVVLESGSKPPPPPGPRGLDAFGHEPNVTLPEGEAVYTLIALGRRDAAPDALRPLTRGVRVAGMTSDVTVLITDRVFQPGETIDFAVDYEGLVLAVTSPFVTKRFVRAATPVSAAPLQD